MSWKAGAAITGLLCAAVAIAVAMEDRETGTVTWDASRASGFAGYLLLWAAVLTGILQYFRFRIAGGPLSWVLESHRMLSVLGLSFTVVHVFALLLDPVVHFSVIDGLLPFTSDYRPVQVGLGTVAQWLLVVVLATTALAHRMPYTTWRTLHYLAFPCWLLALVHGITSGTDTAATAAALIYGLTAASVVGATVLRLFGRGWANEAPARA